MKSIAIGLHLEPRDIEGIADAIPAAGLVISSISVADDQPLGDRELLLRVADVRARLVARATFIAVRYGFTFRTAAEAESKIAADAKRWRSTLEENRTRVELTLKVAAAHAVPKPDRAAFKSGADYLRALHAAKNAVSIDDRFRASVEKHLGALCVAQKWITRDTASIEFAGLIERNVLERLAEAGEALKLEHPGVPFLLSAPWPLEVFADADRQ